MIDSRCHTKFGILIGTGALMGTEKVVRWGKYVRKWFFCRERALTTCKRAAPWMPRISGVIGLRCPQPQTSVSIIESSCTSSPPISLTFIPFPIGLRSFGRAVSVGPISDFLPIFEALLTSNSLSFQMLSQRILARRLPQVAARHAIAPRASFSQVAALRAAEAEDPLQV